MNREQAIAHARQYAKAHEGDHQYMNKVDENWMPHEWVIDALMHADNPQMELLPGD
ncbi:hypothetical protein [Stenotrophomonas phage BUCT555]|nr:hypothetical protein [Stenotrophomonas phage BUCT555]